MPSNATLLSDPLPAPPPARLHAQDRQRLAKLLEQVDEDRQQLQRDKAEMVGELVALRAAVAEERAAAAASEGAAQQAQHEQQLQEAESALAAERRRAAAAEAQAQALLARVEREHAQHAQQLQALLERLEAAEAAASAGAAHGPGAQGDGGAAQASSPVPPSPTGLTAEDERELEWLHKVRVGWWRSVGGGIQQSVEMEHDTLGSR